MTLDEAIRHAEEVMVENLEKTKDRKASDPIAINCFECADEHRQLAEWLKDYKRLLEQEPCEELADIKNAPSVTPQQKIGHWIEVIDETDSLGNKTWHHECSICGSDKSGWGTYKHCPDCGTKMEVEK